MASPSCSALLAAPSFCTAFATAPDAHVSTPGVPYGRKHHDPHCCSCEGCSSSGRQLYHSPLFLDCCGLVRRVARQLQAQLGFRLGPGNQAYQVRGRGITSH
jgi:hypothetical protein